VSQANPSGRVIIIIIIIEPSPFLSHDWSQVHPSQTARRRGLITFSYLAAGGHGGGEPALAVRAPSSLAGIKKSKNNKDMERIQPEGSI
jgi:hypothetical protein